MIMIRIAIEYRYQRTPDKVPRGVLSLRRGARARIVSWGRAWMPLEEGVAQGRGRRHSGASHTGRNNDGRDNRPAL